MCLHVSHFVLFISYFQNLFHYLFITFFSIYHFLFDSLLSFYTCAQWLLIRGWHHNDLEDDFRILRGCQIFRFFRWFQMMCDILRWITMRNYCFHFINFWCTQVGINLRHGYRAKLQQQAGNWEDYVLHQATVASLNPKLAISVPCPGKMEVIP